MELSRVNNNHGKEELLQFVGNLLKSSAIAILVSALIAIASVMMWERPYSTDRLVDFLTYRYSWPTWNYDATFSLVAELIPVVTSMFTIALMSRAIERASTRREWIFTSILVVLTAIAIVCALLFFGDFPLIVAVFTEPFVFDPPSLEFWYFFVIFCSGFALVTVIHPRNPGMRVLVASLIAAVIGGVFELIMLSILLIGWY